MSVNKSRLQLLVPILAVFFAVACTDPLTGPRTVRGGGQRETPFATPEEDCRRFDEPDNRRENEETCTVH